MDNLFRLAEDVVAADPEIALMTSSSQSATPEPPHRVGALTTAELSAYRKLSEVAAEEAERERHKNSRQRWPIRN
jgi:hypothetical protein